MKRLFSAIRYYFFLKKFRSSLYPGMYVTVSYSTRIYKVIRIRPEYLILSDSNNNLVCKTHDLIFPVSS